MKFLSSKTRGRLPTEASTSLSSLIKIGSIANILEWYEISVCGYMVSILGQLFFPSEDKTTATLKTLLIFSLSYLSKPLGSLYFGWLADHRGRIIALRYSLLMMGLPTVLVGFLPTWHSGGMVATCTLIGLRIIQGFATGGEGPISATYVFESAPLKHRGLFCSIVHTSALLGIFSASCVSSLLFNYFDEAEILNWAWRLPFLIGIPLIIGIGWIRTAMIENNHKHISSSEIQDVEVETGSKKIPTWYGIVPRSAMVTILIMAFFLVTGHIVFASWFPIYLSEFLGVSREIAYSTHSITIVARIVFCLGIGYLSDQLGFKRLMIVSLIATLCMTLPLFYLLIQHHNFTVILISQLLFALLLSGIDGTYLEMMATTFPKPIRSRGMAWTYTGLATALSGSTPFLCGYVIKYTGWTLFPAFYILFFGCLALISIVLMQKQQVLFKPILRVKQR